ncbi:thioredoxin H1-like [Diospyros lotus]|uniref:thioredoxin H1-like n=1 Tax=Diospyros lotus TaxID=55363 RepID=UPI0022555090|nr:thioredoxin H1-like [Diospyros lotus]
MASEEGQVIIIRSVAQWEELLRMATASKKLVVVDFTASWCGPCRLIAPVLAEIAKKMPHVIFLKVDVDDQKSIAEDYGVEAMPTFIFMKEGTIVDKMVGANKDGLQATIDKHAGPVPVTAAA